MFFKKKNSAPKTAQHAGAESKEESREARESRPSGRHQAWMDPHLEEGLAAYEVTNWNWMNLLQIEHLQPCLFPIQPIEKHLRLTTSEMGNYTMNLLVYTL